MGKINFKESTVPSTLNEGELVVVDGVPYFGDSNEVAPANVSGLERWKVKFSDPQEWFDSAEGFGGFFEFPDNTLGFIFRIGAEHGAAQSTLYFARSKDVYGLEWNDKVEIDTVTGADLRNCSVGRGEDGRIIVFCRSLQLSPQTDIGPNLYYSDDSGLTWTKQVIGNPSVNGHSGHGDVIEMTNKYYFTLYNVNLVNICTIDKDMTNFTIVKAYTKADLADGIDDTNVTLTEAAIVKISDSIIFGVLRNDNSLGVTLEFYSEDGGDTWSELKASTIKMDRNPPNIKVFDNFVYWNYPCRQTGGSGVDLLKNSYILTYKPVSQILNTNNNWMAYKKLFEIPIHLGDLDPEGNVERGFIFKRNNSLYLMWSEGSYMRDTLGGESVHFIKNIGKFN